MTTFGYSTWCASSRMSPNRSGFTPNERLRSIPDRWLPRCNSHLAMGSSAKTSKSLWKPSSLHMGHSSGHYELCMRKPDPSTQLYCLRRSNTRKKKGLIGAGGKKNLFRPLQLFRRVRGEVGLHRLYYQKRRGTWLKEMDFSITGSDNLRWIMQVISRWNRYRNDLRWALPRSDSAR